MPGPNNNYPKSNSGSEYFNQNICRSFSQPVNATLSVLTGAAVAGAAGEGGFPCSEVIIINRTGQNIWVYDRYMGGYTSSAENFAFQMEDNESFTFRGLTNVNQVSAKTAGAPSGQSEIYYRTQYYSSNPSR